MINVTVALRVCIQKVPSDGYFYYRGTIYAPTNSIKGRERACWSLLNGKRFRRHWFSMGTVVDPLTPDEVTGEKAGGEIRE